MTNIDTITRLCKIRDTLEKTDVFFNIKKSGFVNFSEGDFHNLFAVIDDARDLVDDAIRHAARDLTEEEAYNG